MTCLIEDLDQECRINLDETDSQNKLHLINHHLGIQFPPIPFLWHFNDFAQPFPIYGIKKINMEKLKTLVWIDDYPSLKNLNDSNTDIYILAQYKKEKVMYSELSMDDEVYISYHTWLYYNFTHAFAIPDFNIKMKFRFWTGLYKITGEINTYPYYPFKNNIKTKKHGGICVDQINLDSRQATIHRSDNVVKFSSHNVCNFNQTSDNSVFLSVIQSPHIYFPNHKENIKTKEKKTNCIVLHIFRNVADNNPYDRDYQSLINFFMA